MKKLSATLVSLALLSSPGLCAGEVYRVIDKNGQVTFTDAPRNNAKAEAIHLPATNIAVAPPLPSKTTPEGDAIEEEVPYTSARIAKPLNKATIPPGQTSVAIELNLQPALQEGHRVQLYIDGRPQGSPAASGTFSVAGLFRGKHTANAVILGADKKRKIKTQTVSFFVKQHSSNR
ncbi:hypothetical protein A9Q89_10140 [Gammaproteobacteria bacterium 53_120_T64]|nr:hypothetical protein A9Q89_10140 [Gammaproteobacteria bacterium 53_120_T64]